MRQLSLVAAAVLFLMGLGTLAEEAKTGTYTGTLTSVDLTDQVIAVEKKPVTKRFKVGEHASIITLENKDQATLKDLRTGYTVKVSYSQTNGTAIASSIVELKAPGQK